MTKRDIELAEFQGKVIEKLENIETKLNEINPLSCRVSELENYVGKQKAYYAAAVFIGGLIIALVDWIIRMYLEIKK